MRIGIAAENRPREKRVILQPPGINKIVEKCEVIVEKGAGLGIDITDNAFIKAGCNVERRMIAIW